MPWRRLVLVALLAGALGAVGSGIAGYVAYRRVHSLALDMLTITRESIGNSPDGRTSYVLSVHALFSHLDAQGEDPALRPPGSWTLRPPRWAEEGKWPQLEPGDQPGRRIVLAVGLPFRAFTGCLEYDAWFRDPAWVPAPWVPRSSPGHDAWVHSQRASEPDWETYTIRRGWDVRAPPWLWFDLRGSYHALPTHVLLGPFLANWVIWSLAAGALFGTLRARTILRAVRGTLRRRRGCCPACGYSLAHLGTAGGVCPECGVAGPAR